MSVTILEQLSEDDVRDYLLDLIKNKERSHSYVNQALSAIKFLYESVVKQGKIVINIPRAKREEVTGSIEPAGRFADNGEG